MCFSAIASFTASTLLIPTGWYCLHIAQHRDRRYQSLATIPLLFGIQQACEGGVWVGLQHNNPTLSHLCALLFLAFSHGCWLIWVPWSVAQCEPHPFKQRVCYSLLAIGTLFALSLQIPFWSDAHTIAPQILRGSIDYQTVLWWDAWVTRDLLHLIYGCIVVVPFMLTGNLALQGFAALIALSAAITHITAHDAFVSIWCFWAALISLNLGLILHRLPAIAPEFHPNTAIEKMLYPKSGQKESDAL